MNLAPTILDPLVRSSLTAGLRASERKRAALSEAYENCTEVMSEELADAITEALEQMRRNASDTRFILENSVEARNAS